MERLAVTASARSPLPLATVLFGTGPQVQRCLPVPHVYRCVLPADLHEIQPFLAFLYLFLIQLTSRLQLRLVIKQLRSVVPALRCLLVVFFFNWLIVFLLLLLRVINNNAHCAR